MNGMPFDPWDEEESQPQPNPQPQPQPAAARSAVEASPPPSDAPRSSPTFYAARRLLWVLYCGVVASCFVVWHLSDLAQCCALSGSALQALLLVVHVASAALALYATVLVVRLAYAERGRHE